MLILTLISNSFLIFFLYKRPFRKRIIIDEIGIKDIHINAFISWKDAANIIVRLGGPYGKSKYIAITNNLRKDFLFKQPIYMRASDELIFVKYTKEIFELIDFYYEDYIE